MDPSATPKQKDKNEGFVSAESKKSFTNIAGLVGGASLALQFIIPMVFMYATMPGMFFGNVAVPQLDNAVFWKGKIWFTEMRVGSAAQEPTFRLKRMSLEPPALEAEREGPIVESVAKISTMNPYLLPAGRDLWVLSTYDDSAVYRDNQLLPLPELEFPEGASEPFVYEGRPSVSAHTSMGYRIQSLDGERWRDADVSLYLPADWQESGFYGFQVVESGGKLVSFYRGDQALFFLPRLPTRPEDSKDWTRVGSGDNYIIARGTHRPTVLMGKRTDMQVTLTMMVWNGSVFEMQGQLPPFTVMQNTAFGVPDDESTYLLSMFFPGSFSLRRIEDGEIVSRQSYGQTVFSNMGDLMVLPNVIAVVLTLLVLMAYSLLMPKYRTMEYSAESGGVLPYASLPRRAAAQALDSIAIGAPFVLVWIATFDLLSDLESNLSVDSLLHMLGVSAGAAAWFFFGLVALSITEGLWGATPGKWAMGIRVVGLDLQPCGVGRGLVRNLFKIIDGMFNFMVGLMLVALSPKWQRLGDMVAKTVVIRRKDATSRPLHR